MLARPLADFPEFLKFIVISTRNFILIENGEGELIFAETTDHNLLLRLLFLLLDTLTHAFGHTQTKRHARHV